jgi:hypothetical protein
MKVNAENFQGASEKDGTLNRARTHLPFSMMPPASKHASNEWGYSIAQSAHL